MDSHSCENCGITPLQRFEVPNHTTLWKCTACGLYQKGHPPTDETYETTYHDNYLQALPRKIRTAQVRLSRASSFLDTTRPEVLDIGCSIGSVVSAATARGWGAHGVDVSRSAVDVCRSRGLNCEVFDGKHLPYADATFDLVTSWHVIEHVTNVATTLQEWFRVLKPGGMLVLETPDANCWKARIQGAKYKRFWSPQHIYTFTPDTLAPFVRRAGFSVLPTPHVVIPQKTGWAVATYAAAYQIYLSVPRITGFSKAFQTFARRPRAQAIRYDEPVKSGTVAASVAAA